MFFVSESLLYLVEGHLSSKAVYACPPLRAEDSQVCGQATEETYPSTKSGDCARDVSVALLCLQDFQQMDEVQFEQFRLLIRDVVCSHMHNNSMQLWMVPYNLYDSGSYVLEPRTLTVFILTFRTMECPMITIVKWDGVGRVQCGAGCVGVTNTAGFVHRAGVTARRNAGFPRGAGPTGHPAVSINEGDQR